MVLVVDSDIGVPAPHQDRVRDVEVGDGEGGDVELGDLGAEDDVRDDGDGARCHHEKN